MLESSALVAQKDQSTPTEQTFAQIASDCWHESNSIVLAVPGYVGTYLGTQSGLNAHRAMLAARAAGEEPGLMRSAGVFTRPLLAGIAIGYVVPRAALTAGCMLDRYDNHLAEDLLMAM